MDNKDIKEINDKLDQILFSTDTIAKLAAMVDKHERLLRGGNGDGVGMYATLQAVVQTVNEDHKLLFGDGEKPGLKGKVNELVKTVANYNKFLWIVLSAALGTLVSIWIK